MKALAFEQPIFDLQAQLEELRRKFVDKTAGSGDEITRLEAELADTKERIYREMTPWQRVQIARHVNRPYMLDYIAGCFTGFVELHGDRHIGDDAAMPGGFATLAGRKCVVIGHQKGRDTKDNLKRNFGSAHPEGYRKALRLMRLAERFQLPVVALIDTPGAFPGIGAEERNIAEAIAFNLKEMMVLRTPIISVVIGEGGSGGALGIGVADRVLMLENAYYSVISPEGCAAILWKNRSHAPEAAEAMKLAAGDLNKLGVVDGVVKEVAGGAHNDHEKSAKLLGKALKKALDETCGTPIPKLLAARYAKFRKFGVFAEGPPSAGLA